MNKSSLFSVLFFAVIFCCVPFAAFSQRFSKESKPWTYWWWMGSSVTKKGITENLEALCAAGIGGVHIVPIYGEKGDEANFISYLSPEWMEALKHTCMEADRLGMGVDMTPGTGWPFGGPSVSTQDAAQSFFVRKIHITGTSAIDNYLEKTEHASLISLAAYDSKGNYKDITYSVDGRGIIEWKSSYDSCTIFAMFRKPTGQMVKRAAPGGEGLVIDYFNRKSFLNYFDRFASAFSDADISKGQVRAFYNDSYEIYGANWTDDFFEEFRNRRGYDLHPFIRYLGDTAYSETRQRLASDYCETWSDILFDVFTRTWVDKTHDMGMITRNAAHKAPANWLDQYALADIPETEAYGSSEISFPGLRVRKDWGRGGPSSLMMKFASSAANIRGRKLVSSETATWLDDHFKVSLSQVKPQVDELFLSGTNHIFFHGITYSPMDKPFPGRLFYTSTNFGPSSHFWKELPALTRYIADCQTMLQNSAPDNDILLYYPIHEVWKKQRSNLVIKLIGPENAGEWFDHTPFADLANKLLDKGYSFDYISDRMIQGLDVDNKILTSGAATYKTIIIPDCESMPVETLSALLRLAKKGALVIFEGAIPTDVPGLFEVEKRKAQAHAVSSEMSTLKENISSSFPLFKVLAAHQVYAEEMADKGLRFIRKRSGKDRIYFIGNQSVKFREGWIRLESHFSSAEIFDPVTARRGNAALRKTNNGTSIYLQLEPGQSCIVTCSDKPEQPDSWQYLQASKNTKLALNGEWTLTPKEGAPVIPPPVKIRKWESWTNYGGDYETFSGKAIYSSSFRVLDKNVMSSRFLLDLGDVRETARVRINGRDIGLAWCLPNKLLIPNGIIKQENQIEIEVTNLSINRIIKMDKQGVVWKDFYDINFVNIKGQPYDASKDKPEDAGLLSPVYLIPLERKTFK